MVQEQRRASRSWRLEGGTTWPGPASIVLLCSATRLFKCEDGLAICVRRWRREGPRHGRFKGAVGLGHVRSTAKLMWSELEECLTMPVL